jgi:hypothetical protein
VFFISLNDQQIFFSINAEQLSVIQNNAIELIVDF